MTNVSVRITEVMKLKLAVISDKQSMTLPDIMRVAFMDYINRYEKEYGKIDLKDNCIDGINFKRENLPLDNEEENENQR